MVDRNNCLNCIFFFVSRLVDLDVSLPSCEDCMQLTVNFPETSEIHDKENFKLEVLCTLKFSSIKPVSKTDCIIITEKCNGVR